MKFKVGDKVKFLNESGGGIVSKIVHSNLVHVSIEDGFDIPVLPSQIILEETHIVPGRSFFNPKTDENEYGSAAHNTPPTTSLPEVSKLTRCSKLHYGKNAVLQGIYLSFVPHDQKYLIAGGIDVVLMNHTDYAVTYNWLTKEDNLLWEKDSDIIEPQEKILINTYSREQINEILDGYIQILFKRDRMTEIPMPIHGHYKIQGAKFYQENSFSKNSLLNEMAITVTVALWNDVEKIPLNNNSTHKKLQTKEKRESIEKPQTLIEKHKCTVTEAEVDLHISTLRDDFQKLSSGEILIFQLNYFRSTLESAIANKYTKVTYIHGIGNGTLKNKLKDIIREEYPHLGVRSAAFLQYGNGAIDILITT